MPYNNAPIAPSDDITGSSALPLARVKKIIAQDDEIAQCSNEKVLPAKSYKEHFVRYLTEQSYNVVKSEKKPRRNIAYKDISTAVSRIDNLEFLSDVVPKTKTYRQIKEETARAEAAAAAKARQVPGGPNGEPSVKPIEHMMQRQSLTNGGQSNQQMIQQIVHSPISPAPPMSRSPLVHRTILQNGHDHSQGTNDINMTG